MLFDLGQNIDLLSRCCGKRVDRVALIGYLILVRRNS
jgi:hypothetical protein